MSVSITIASGREDVGKTTVAVNLAVAIAKRGVDVTILDTDVEMANLELQFGLEIKKTLKDVLSGDACIEDVIYTGYHGVKIIPVGMPLSDLRYTDADLFLKAIKEIARSSEILILDAPSGLGRDVVTAIAASQDLLLVVNPEVSSMTDALKTKIVTKKLGTNLIGLIINRAGISRTDITTEEIELLLQLESKGVIPEDEEIKKACSTGRPVVISNPDSPAGQVFKEMAANILRTHVSSGENLEERLYNGFFAKV